MKVFLTNLIAKALELWQIPLVNKAGHTFWQAFLAVFLIGISPVVVLVLNHSYSDARTAAFALVVAALAAGLSALKTFLLNWYANWKAPQA